MRPPANRLRPRRSRGSAASRHPVAEPIPTNTRFGSAFSFSLVLAAALPRLLYLILVRPDFGGDYWDLATGLRRWGTFGFEGFQTTRFQPLYPLFIAAVRSVARDSPAVVQVAQVALAALGAVFLYRLVVELAGRRTARLTVGLYAVYPLLIRHSADASDTALTVTLLLGFAASFVTADTPRRAAGAGIWLGLAVLTRSVVLPVAVLAAMLLLARRRASAAAALVGAVLIVMAPWGLRNTALNGWPMPTRSGLNLFIANSEYTPDLLPAYGPDVLVPYANAVIAPLPGRGSVPVRERVMDIAWTRAALGAIRERPGAIAWLKLRNLGYFFSPRLVPTHESTAESDIRFGADHAFEVVHSPPRSTFHQVVYTLSYTPILMLAIAGVYFRRGALSDDAILWCLLATVAVVHVVYFPTTRYRAIVDFVLLFYAAVAIDRGLAARRPAGQPA